MRPLGAGGAAGPGRANRRAAASRTAAGSRQPEHPIARWARSRIESLQKSWRARRAPHSPDSGPPSPTDVCLPGPGPVCERISPIHKQALTSSRLLPLIYIPNQACLVQLPSVPAPGWVVVPRLAHPGRPQSLTSSCVPVPSSIVDASHSVSAELRSELWGSPGLVVCSIRTSSCSSASRIINPM